MAFLLLLLAFGGQAESQEGDALRFFQQNPARPLFRAPAAQRRFEPRRTERRQPQEGYQAIRRRAQPEPEEPETPAVPPTTFVHVVGDALAEALAQGLKEQFAETRPEVGVVRRIRPSSGLVREDHHDWPKALRELVAGPDKIDLIVMMVGSNDRQSLRDETGGHEFGSDRWREIYGKRIDDILAIAREKRLPLVLVGMPIMQGPRASADMLVVNALLKERATRGGAAFVDIWEGFATEKGEYSSTGPDVNGANVRLRASDGVLFTRAGARKLGFFVGKDVLEQLARERPPEIAALPNDLSEQIRREQPGMTPQGLINAVPLPELPALPTIGQRPLAGPAMALTAPPQSPDGVLLRGRLSYPATEMGILIEQAFAYGRPPPAKPGRADDFSWPKPTRPIARGEAAPLQPVSAAAGSRP